MSNLYANIKARRMALGFSQTELAQKVGYADKGMISRIENGRVDLSQSQIINFARALECSPATLMGFEETNHNKVAEINSAKNEVLKRLYALRQELDNISPIDYYVIHDNDEKTLIEAYRKLDESAKKRLIRYSEMELKG